MIDEVKHQLTRHPPKWDLVRALLRSGDTLVTTRLDRLGRSMLHLVTLGADSVQRGSG
jgi:hypothetical protein